MLRSWRRTWLGFAVGLALPPGFSVAQQAAARPSGENAERAGRFEFTLKTKASTSAGVYDSAGRLIRPLWSLKTLDAGSHSGRWFARDQFEQPVSGEGFELRVVVNNGSYTNVGIIGNSGNDRKTHTPGNMRSVAVDSDGAVYTANDWEEAGADFKKWDKAGQSVYDADFQIRNGDPNGAPYAIAVDDQYLYCTMAGWPREPYNSKQQVQRFRKSDGKLEPFTGITENLGHIQLYEWPERQIPKGTSKADYELKKGPLHALAVSGETLYVCDALGGRVVLFHKTTGERKGELPISLPTAIAFRRDGQVWVGHEHTKVSTLDAGGAAPTEKIADIGEVRALAFGPDDRLYVADGASAQVRIYTTTDGAAKLVGTFGKKAAPGDSAPDRFYDLKGVAVDREGGLATIQTLAVGSARLARWSPQGTFLWEQLGLEFGGLGNYSRRRPDEFLSLQFNRYRLDRAKPATSEFRGNLFVGDPRYSTDIHGVPRVVTLGSNEFYYTGQGDGMQVYRREGETLQPCTRVGGRWPTVDGRRDEKGPLGQWTWHDANGDRRVDGGEVAWYLKPGSGKYSLFGMNVDVKGNLLYCDQETRSICELPLTGVDPRGNPVYDWSKLRVLVHRDRSRAKMIPHMAVRADDGTLYAFGKSDTWKEPTNHGAWMGGWALARYDPRGRMYWAVPLPEVCVGMDSVPGGGVMLGWFQKAHVFHYNGDGLHIGTAVPGPASGGLTGWLDNTASLAANRDPRDRIVDVFTSDNYLYRILWYRIDDRAIETIRAKIVF